MKSSKVLHVVAIAGLVWGLVALSAAAQVTISFWHGYNELETQVLVERVIPAFEAKYPDIKVESVRLGYDELRDKVVTTAAAGGGPDVMRLDIIWTPGFAASGLLEPLDRYLGFSELLAEVYPGPLSTNYFAGRYYGLPLTTNTQIYVYNAELFAQAGLAAPSTFDEFEEVSKLLTRQEGGEVTRWGYDIGGPWAWHLLPWIWSNGGDVTDPEITVATGYLDGAASVGALERIVDWAMAGFLAPNIFMQGFDSWGAFLNGQLAARQDGPWFPRWLEENNPDFPAGFALIPAGEGGQSISVVGGENIAIASGSANKEAAWTFVRFMLSDEAQSIMATVGQMPVIRSAIAIPEFMESTYYPTYLEQVATAKARTPHPRYGEIEQVIQAAFWQAISGEASPRAALEDAARRVNGLLR